MATATTSGSKTTSGKEKSAKHPRLEWELSWEHALGLAEDTPRPVAWSKTNTIFFAHPSLPRVCGRYIHPHASLPSNTFELSVPPQLLLSPSPCGPPTIISLAPNDAWLFAYFPSSILNDGDGVACIYQGASVPGVWSITHLWHVQRGNGVVSCRWLGHPREWAVSSDERMPHRQPPIGMHANRPPMLLIATQSHHIELLCRPSGQVQSSPFVHMKAPLYTPWGTMVDGPPIPQSSSVSQGGSRVCIRAVIGFSANNQSIIVATWSRLLPAWSFSGLLDGPDFHLSTKASPPFPDNSSWESWGDEGKICLTEVVLDYNSVKPTKPGEPIKSSEPTLETIPMPAISVNTMESNMDEEDGVEPASALQLTHLEFMTSPPRRSRNTSVEVKKELVEDVTMDENGANQGAQSDDDNSQALHLIASFIDLNHYKTPPKSVLKVWKLGHEVVGGDQGMSPYVPGSGSQPPDREIVSHLLASRTLDTCIVSILQRQPLSYGQQLLLGTINLKGNISLGSDEGPIGSLRVINMDLEDDGAYKEVTLYGGRQTVTQNLPAHIALSPSRILGALTPNGHHSSELKIIRTPTLKAHKTNSSQPLTEDTSMESQETLRDLDRDGSQNPVQTAQHQQHALAAPMALSILRNCDLTDAIRAFWSEADASVDSATKLLHDVADTLETALPGPTARTGSGVDLKEGALGGSDRGLSPLDPRMIGLTLGLFKAAPDPKIAERWPVASYLILLRSAKDAFVELKPIFSANDFSTSNETPPLTKMIGFTKRYVEVCEMLVKEAIIWEAWRACGADRMDAGLEQQESDAGPEPSGALICFLHPEALDLLIDVLSCIKGMLTHLTQVNHIMKKPVAAIMGDAKVDFEIFVVVSNEISKTLQADPLKYADHLRDALLSLSLPLGLRPLVNTCTELINKRPGLSQKLSLLVPSLNFPDFDDQDGKMTVTTTTTNKFASVLGPKAGEPNMPPLKVCNRCGEMSETQLHDLMSPTFYGAYVRKWRRQCYCGGFWVIDRLS
ncbi:hypothetical protein FRB94_014578 [Tulasnella sp. JGI-2019a]|nr:hypothetical protein FRB93_010973 [Tulasnella sp. JGI-2019a]KAG9007195.1 hypothetical protein FRB94_014578 [Tulasnella sp. JGI-2019a]